MVGINSPLTPRGGFVTYLKIILSVFFLFPLWGSGGWAHPMPNSLVLMNVQQHRISGEIQIPLGELQSAIGLAVNDSSLNLVNRLGGTLRVYLLQHIRPTTFDGKAWSVEVGAMQVHETTNPLSGAYKELTVQYSMKPPPNADLRNFYFNYDAVVHQVITHRIIVAVKQDWQKGQLTEDVPTEVGVIELDIPTGKVPPFQVSLQQGSAWIGFKSMVWLGINHIKEGIDHLLFLLTLLLQIQPPPPPMGELKKVAPLTQPSKAVRGLFRVLGATITAFTIGHSLTLILGALKVVHLPSQIVEVLIAVTILISAVHVIKPIFTGREMLVIGGFGLIHGLAFADTLTNLQLDTKELALSILGFNVGIELMQLFVIALTLPFLILFSKTRFYVSFRTSGAILTIIAALYWIVERVS